MPGKKKPHGIEKPIRTVGLNIDGMEASYELLNRLEVWQGRIRYTFATRKGPMQIAKTDTGATIVWPTMADFHSFTKSQAIIDDCARIFIPTPPQGLIRKQWEDAVEMFSRITNTNTDSCVELEPPLKEETRYLLDLAWGATGHAQARDSAEFIDTLRRIKNTPRNPGIVPGTQRPDGKGIQVIPPVVFIAEENLWVHVPSFRLWLSIPSLINRQPPLTDIRNGLLLLEFTYRKNVSRGFDGDSETAALWQGPLETLGD